MSSHEKLKRASRISADEISYGEVLGKGTFGEVWAAEYNGTHVAVKRLQHSRDPKRLSEDFWTEVNVMVQLNHPNIVQLIGVGWTDKSELLMVSEWLDGDLMKYLSQHPNLSLFDRLRLARDLAVGLAFLHNHKPQIVHRDLKPENCLVTAQGLLKIADFGLAFTFEPGKVITPSVHAPGTVIYHSPEVLDALDSPDFKCDVYSFGLVFWSILTGKAPFADYVKLGSREKFVDAILLRDERPVLLTEQEMPGVDPVNSLIKRCWAALPDHRPTMVDVIAEIDNIILRDMELLPSFVCNFWSSLIKKKDVNRHAITWVTFVTHILEHMAVPLAQRQAYISGTAEPDDVMKALLGMKLMLINENEHSIIFQRFAYFFGTFAYLGVQDIRNILEYFYECCKLPYFYGELSASQQSANLSVFTPNMIMVRVASNPTAEAPLTLSIRTEGGASNKKIFHTPGGSYRIYQDATNFVEAPTIHQLITQFVPDFVLPTLPTMFSHIVTLQKTAQTYW